MVLGIVYHQIMILPSATAYDGCLSDCLFSFILEPFMWSKITFLPVQECSVLYITIINKASLQELVMQGLEEKLEKVLFPLWKEDLAYMF